MLAKALVSALALAAVGVASATSFTFDASNAGSIDPTIGRDLNFNLFGVDGPIVQATLELELDYSEARELSIALTDPTGVVQMRVVGFTNIPAGVGARGVYRFDDRSKLAWPEIIEAAGDVPTILPTRAAQPAPRLGSYCLNHIARFLEHDLEARDGQVRLMIRRLIAGPGTGSITRARLRLHTEMGDTLFATGIEEPANPAPPCRRPPFDLVFNGGNDLVPRSPLSMLHRDASNDLNWGVLQLFPLQDFGPTPFGDLTARAYPGRFGGRSRMNIGYWDASSGTLNFNTGAGIRSESLSGAWAGNTHKLLPGDYDGDGITDVAVAFLGVGMRWNVRVRFSANGDVGDYVIDPRSLRPAEFTAVEIGFGIGQDADGNGSDEINVYARMSSASNAMALMRIDLNALRAGGSVPYVFTNAHGQVGDRMISGKWSNATGVDQLGVMVTRFSGGNWQWHRQGTVQATIFGQLGDFPIAIDADGDGLNDIAVYRPADRRWVVLQSSNQAQVTFGPYGEINGEPLGYAVGSVNPLLF